MGNKQAAFTEDQLEDYQVYKFACHYFILSDSSRNHHSRYLNNLFLLSLSFRTVHTSIGLIF